MINNSLLWPFCYRKTLSDDTFNSIGCVMGGLQFSVKRGQKAEVKKAEEYAQTAGGRVLCLV